MNGRGALRLSLVFSLILAPGPAQGPLSEMHAGIRAYLQKLPVKQAQLPAHPLLLEADRCEATGAREVVVLLSYRKLDCAKYPKAIVIAPRLIAPELRERVRRLGYPFAQIPLGFELAHFQDAQKRYRMPVRLEPPLAELLGPVDKPRPQENAFGLSIRRHDERVVERVTDNIAPLEKHLLSQIPAAETRRATLLRTSGPRGVAKRWQEEVVGLLPAYNGPFRERERTVAEAPTWTATSLTIDALPGVIAQAVLLRPKGMREFERRPLVVVQHGLMGRPEWLFQQRIDSAEYRTYRNFAEKLLAAGFIVLCPQNPYTGNFRDIQLLANPRGLSLFSFITAQYSRLLDYVQTLPNIDGKRIGYYGLSYGGATALRVPVFDPRFRAIVCGGNFNEWIRKLIDPTLRYSYVHTAEYEIYEWNQANIASHAELAALGANLHQIPFLVERGHRDPVGEDKWVEYEFDRLKAYVKDVRLRQLAYFDGDHRTDGAAAIPFLKVSLGIQ